MGNFILEVLVAAIVWAPYDQVTQSAAPRWAKIVWSAVILGLPGIGALIWLLAGPRAVEHCATSGAAAGLAAKTKKPMTRVAERGSS